jgi:hypothetical protein
MISLVHLLDVSQAGVNLNHLQRFLLAVQPEENLSFGGNELTLARED